MIQRPGAGRRARRLSNATSPWRPSMLLLLLGIALLIGAAAQAWATERSHRETVAQVLRDYAAAAAWTFDQEARSTLSSDLHMAFHPLHGETELPDPAVLVLPRADQTECLEEILGQVRFAVRVPLDGPGELQLAGYATPRLAEQLHEELAEALRRHRHETTERDRFTRSAVFPLALDGEPHLVAYTTLLHDGVTYAYAYALDATAVRPFFERILTSRRLLPATLMGELPDSEALVLHVRDPDGGVLFSRGTGTSEYVAEGPLERMGGIEVSAGILPEAARLLIIGGPPTSRTPMVAGLLLLALGLLAVAIQQLRREHALARLRADFVSSVSHELRTPLALQRVFLDMLALGRVDTPERKQWCIDNIDRESMRLAHLVENVLHFSRTEQGTMKVNPAVARLAPAVTEIADAFRPLGAPVKLRVELEVDERIEVPYDAGALRQMLMNVLENALKYGPERQTVRVTTVMRGSAAEIRVDDQGPGIPAAERDAVFEPFRRGCGTAESAVAGSGIGLAVVRQLARGHGGDALALDAPGGGARLTIRLPHARLAAADVSVQSAVAHGSLPTQRATAARVAAL